MMDFPPLEVECERCKGEGRYKPDYYADSLDHKISCGVCEGYGYVPTEFGEAVLKFVDRRLNLGRGK